MPRPRTHDDAVRERLLVLAGREVASGGVDGLSLRNLARTADTSTTAVYSLFGGKAGLLQAVFDEAFARFAAHLSEVEVTGDSLEDLLRLGHAYRASALADPHFYPLMFGSAISADYLSSESQERAGATFEPLRQAVRRAIAAGAFRTEDPTRVTTALWAAVHGLVSLELAGCLSEQLGDHAEFYDAAIRATLAGWS